MREGKVENLKPQNTRTKDEQREIARLGGIASGEARRRKKTFREIAEAIGSASMRSGDAFDIESIEMMGDLKGANLSLKEVMIWQQIQKAINGDTKAFEVVMGVLGEQPTDKVEVQVQQNKDSLDKLVAQMEE